MVNPGRRVLSPPRRAGAQTALDQVQLGTGPELASRWLPRLPSPAARQTVRAYLVAHPTPVMTPGLAGVVAQSLGQPEAVFEFTRAAVAELAPEDPRLQDFETVVRAAAGDRPDQLAWASRASLTTLTEAPTRDQGLARLACLTSAPEAVLGLLAGTAYHHRARLASELLGLELAAFERRQVVQSLMRLPSDELDGRAIDKLLSAVGSLQDSSAGLGGADGISALRVAQHLNGYLGHPAPAAPVDPEKELLEAIVDHCPESLLRLAGLLEACPRMARDETVALVGRLAAGVVKTAETHHDSGVLLRMAREATGVCRELLIRLDPPPSLALGIIDHLAGEPEALRLGVALAHEPVTPKRLTEALATVRAAQRSTTPDLGPFQAADAFLLSALRAVDPRAADLAELAGMPGPQALERARQLEPEQPAGGLVEELLGAPAGLVAVAKLIDTTPEPEATALELTSRLPVRDGSQWEQKRLTHQGHAVLTALLVREPQARLALELAHQIGPEPRVFGAVHTVLSEGPAALASLTKNAVTAGHPEALWLTSQRFEQMAPQEHPEFVALTRSILEGLPNPRQRLHFLDLLTDRPVPRSPLEFVNWSQTMTEGLGESVLPLLSGASSFAATLSGPTTHIEVGADTIDFLDGQQVAIQD